MIEYSADGQTAAYCGYRFRRDPKTGYFLCTKKTDIGRRERLHCFVYRRAHGLAILPEGYQVHHKDTDKNNNEPDNLELLPSGEHQRLHGAGLTDAERQARRENLLRTAVQTAREWHHTEQGREWHREHGKIAMEHRKPRQYTCANCCASFKTKRIYGAEENAFCSNACKSAHRRKAGTDDIKRECPVCGREFNTNKYRPAETCSRSCSNRRRAMRNG